MKIKVVDDSGIESERIVLSVSRGNEDANNIVCLDGKGKIDGTMLELPGTTIRKNTGPDIGNRKRLNFIEGSNISLDVADDATDEEIDITIGAAAIPWRTRRPIHIYPSPITMSSVAIAGPLSSGIVTITGGWQTVDGDADGPRRSINTINAVDSTAGISFEAYMRSSFNIDVTLKCRIVETTLRRFWFGFFTATPMASDAPTAVHWGIRLSTSAGNTNFVLSTADGTTQSEIQILPADTAIHTFRLITDHANLRVGASVDGGSITWKTTNYPTGTVNVGLFALLRTLVGDWRYWHFAWIEGYSDK